MLGRDDRSSHTSIIREYYVFLLETLDVKLSGLVSQLYSSQIISAVDKEDIESEQTSFRANEKLLSVLSRKSPQQFQLFLDALDKCGQQHIRNVISDRSGLSILNTNTTQAVWITINGVYIESVCRSVYSLPFHHHHHQQQQQQDLIGGASNRYSE